MNIRVMFFVYIIVSDIKGLRFYVGLTANLENRLKEHNSGKTKSTKGYIPWSLFFTKHLKPARKLGSAKSITNPVQERKKLEKVGI